MRDDKDRSLVKIAHAAMHLPEESATERACVSGVNAVEDLNYAIHVAKSPEELRQVRATIEDIIAQLLISSSVALTLDEFWGQR